MGTDRAADLDLEHERALDKIADELRPELDSDPAKQIRHELREVIEQLRGILVLLGDLDGSSGD